MTAQVSQPVCHVDLNTDSTGCIRSIMSGLQTPWRTLLFRAHPGILRVNGRPVLVGDGIKVAKAGRKMPGVKKLHQESDSNHKPEYIFGHSCQAVAVLTQAMSSKIGRASCRERV